MKEWTHEELHELMEKDPEIKLRSDEVHKIPETDDLTQRERNKILMMAIYADSISCNDVRGAQQMIRDVFAFVKNDYEDWAEWGISSTDQDFEKIAEISAKYQIKNICHSPKGNNYICYCSDLI